MTEAITRAATRFTAMKIDDKMKVRPGQPLHTSWMALGALGALLALNVQAQTTPIASSASSAPKQAAACKKHCLTPLEREALATGAATAADGRWAVDRMHPQGNPDGKSYAYLDGIGITGAYDPKTRHKLGGIGTGFLVDACHVLTNLHVAFPGDFEHAPAFVRDYFAVGQTPDGSEGRLKGLSYLYEGAVVAHGESGKKGRHVTDSSQDWALIKLDDNVDPHLPFLAPVPLNPLTLTQHTQVQTAGYPGGRTAQMPQELRYHYPFMAPPGDTVHVVYDFVAQTGVLVESLTPITPGSSGSPVLGLVHGKHVSIGLAQGVYGEEARQISEDTGLNPTQEHTNRFLLFSPFTYAEIRRGMLTTPCQ